MNMNMLGYKSRVGRRVKNKIAKNIERQYEEARCRECSVVVTRMDFAKILGKFTKVKIQYENNSSPKVSKSSIQNSNVRLKSNENGMVLMNRKNINSLSKEIKKSRSEIIKDPLMPSPKKLNILKENNNYKNLGAQKEYSNTKRNKSENKNYGIIFLNPVVNGTHDTKIKVSLADLIPSINKNLLPNEDWCIEFFPKNLEPKDDKMYNRIAAELEDLMYNKINTTSMSNESKGDDFPSIMDILNDNTTENTPSQDQTSLEFKPNMESSDVEAMLLGKGENKPTPMEIDKSDVNKLKEEVVDFVPSTETEKSIKEDEIQNPHSPSILDETLQKGVEEHLPTVQPVIEDTNNITKNAELKLPEPAVAQKSEPDTSHTVKYEEVTEIIFKKILDGKCVRSVTCLKSLKYNIQIDEDCIELLGAPKYISSIEDIQVLLQIVNDSAVDSSYMLH
ncbi:unnamed protein product [Leptosia nina]|uniref:Uncharacterized protein n=1 Tax=Leptosia nina TaxID=320188 RepID=A0AAV1J515_9NEOP